MIELQTQYGRLDKTEAKKLSALLKQRHGNAAECSRITKLHINTLKRAKEGLEIKKDNLTIIREKLLVNQLEVA